jgi:hypothetical protein
MHAAGSLLVVLAAAWVATAAPPSVVLLVGVDRLGWGDVGFRGSPIPTPALDALAAESVRARDGLWAFKLSHPGGEEGGCRCAYRSTTCTRTARRRGRRC